MPATLEAGASIIHPGLPLSEGGAPGPATTCDQVRPCDYRRQNHQQLSPPRTAWVVETSTSECSVR
jgi:hypothetical protein